MGQKKIISRKKVDIEWGDCDPAQIVYFPRYFAYFDACTTALFKKAGLPKKEMLKKYGIIGIPVVDVRASFKAPSRFSDVVVVESEITEWRNSSFCVRHRLFNKGILAVDCLETRVWAVCSATDPEKIESKTAPRTVIDKFFVGNNLRRGSESLLKNSDHATVLKGRGFKPRRKHSKIPGGFSRRGETRS